MSKLRLILTYILLPLEMAGGSIKTPAQTPTPASRQDCSPASCHPARSVLKGPHATVYLFGSVHLLAKDREWRTPVLNTAPASSQTLWLEVTGAEDPKVAQAIVMELGIDASHPLSTKLSKDQLAKLDSEAKTFNMSEAMMEPMRPWLAAVTLDVAPAGSWHRPQQRRRIDLDRRIQEEQSHGAGLRDRLAAIPLLRRPARKDWTCLNLSINDFAKQPEQSKQLVEAWYKGDQNELDRLVNEEWRQEHPETYEVLIAKRNLYFVQRIDELVKGEGTSFVAIVRVTLSERMALSLCLRRTACRFRGFSTSNVGWRAKPCAQPATKHIKANSMTISLY